MKSSGRSTSSGDGVSRSLCVCRPYLGGRSSFLIKEDLHVTPLRGSPCVIDEITHGTLLHIERMDKHGYFFRLGDAVFSIRSAARHGAGVEIVAVMVPGYDG